MTSQSMISLLANRSMRSDKRRNLFIMFTIFFTACLLTAFSLFIFGKSHELKVWLQGRYQAAVVDTGQDMIGKLQQDERVELAGSEVKVSSFRRGDYTLSINYRDENDLYLRSIGLEGRLPKQENEVALSRSYLEHIGLDAQLNDEILIALQDGVEKTWRITGFLTEDSSNRNYELLVSGDYLKARYNGQVPYTAVLRMADSDQVPSGELKETILTHLSQYGITEKNVAFSSSYFESIDNSSQNMLVTVLVGILLAGACGLVIYSIFYISVVGKIKEYGRLRIVGATQKQIRRIVQKESRRLSFPAIITGAAAGCLIGYLLIPNGWYWPNTLKCTLVAVILTEVSVLFSVRKPTKLAARVTPVEAVRITSTADTEGGSSRRRKRHKLTPQALAVLNFGRNRKKTALTLISLGFTGILLMAVGTYLSSVDEESLARQMFGEKEIFISLSPDETEDFGMSYVDQFRALQREKPLNEELIRSLSEHSLITEVSVLKALNTNLYLPDNSNVESSPNFAIAGLTVQEMSKYQDALVSGSMNYEEMADGNGIIVDDSAGILKTFCAYDAAVGDTIQIESDTGEKIPFTVVGLVDLRDSNYAGTYFFIPEELLSRVDGTTDDFSWKVAVRTEFDNIPKVEEFVFGLFQDNPNVTVESFLDVILYAEEHLRLYAKPLYGLVLLVGIFAIINLINTLMTNFLSRQKEYGVLQSIGLSGSQLLVMLRTESLCYVFGTLLITLTVGSAVGYAVCKVFDNIGIFGKLTYHFPVLPVIIFTLLLLAVWLIYAIVAQRICKKQSLIDCIKAGE